MPSGADFRYDEDDRLPWLETVEDDDRRGPSVPQIAIWVILGLALIAAVGFGLSWFQGHRTGTSGNGELIAAQGGDYKVKPDDPGGMNVEGEGDTVFSTSEGEGAANGSIAVTQLPEAPVQGRKAGTAKAAPGSARTAAAVPASGGPLTATPPARPVAGGATSAASGGALVQLGSFPDAASANAAWVKVSRRIAYVAPLSHSVVQAQVNGRTVNRLRVDAGSAGQASELCGKLKVAGEACFVARD